LTIFTEVCVSKDASESNSNYILLVPWGIATSSRIIATDLHTAQGTKASTAMITVAGILLVATVVKVRANTSLLN